MFLHLRATIADIACSAMLVALILVPFQAAKAETIWQISSTTNQASAGTGVEGYDFVQDDTTTPSAYALLDPPGVAYAEASSSYSISANEELVIESFVRAGGDAYYIPGPPTEFGGAVGAGSTDLVIVQPLTRPTRVHIVGSLDRIADTTQPSAPSYFQFSGGDGFFVGIESDSGRYAFDETIDVMTVPSNISLRVKTGYTSGNEGGFHSGSSNASITVTMLDIAVPEPSTLTLLACAMLALVGYCARRRRS
jgi:hypothetical protein